MATRSWLAVGLTVAAVLICAWCLQMTTRSRNVEQPPAPDTAPAPLTPAEAIPRESPFVEKLECNVVEVKHLRSPAGRVMLFWTDGTASRCNFEVDMYIDTGSEVDWRKAEAVASVIVRCPTIRSGFFEKIVEIRTANIYKRHQSRGLIRLLNVFDIDLRSSVIHNSGQHKITVEVTIGDQRFQGETMFSID